MLGLSRPLSLPRTPRAVVFDLDGTLIDSEALVLEAWLASCDKLGVTLTDAQFRSFIGMHREHNEAQLRSFYGADFPVETFYAMNVINSVILTFDYQFLKNLAHNADRGPISIFALRLHGEF